jgi:hypothetical protein
MRAERLSPAGGATRQLICLVAGIQPGGGRLAIGIGSGRTQLWNVSYLANVPGRLCSQVGGSVTRVERAQFVPPGLSDRSICP